MQKIIVKIFPLVLCILIVSTLNAQRRTDFITVGRIELSEEHYAKAIENLNIGLKLDPNSYDGYFMRPVAKFQLEDFAGADEDYSKAIELYPYRSETYAQRGYTRDRLFDYPGALADYQKAISLDSGNAEIYLRRAITYLALQQFGRAIEDCSRAEKMHLRDETLYIIRGAAETQLKQFKEAIADYNKAIDRKPLIARTYVDRGMAHAGAGDKDSALIDYELALKIDTVNTFAMFQKALLEADTGKNNEALADLNKVLQLSPYSASAYFNRAILRSKMNDYYGALNDYSAVLSLSPDHILTYYNRAGIEFGHGDLADALKDYDKVIEMYPEFIEAYRKRADIKKSMNNPKAAALDIKKAGELQQAQNSASDSLKYYQGLKVMKLMTLSDDFESDKDNRGKIQNAHNDILPEPIFYVTLFPKAGNKARVYTGAIKLHYGGSELTMFSKSDSMDAGSVKKMYDHLDSAIYDFPAKAFNYIDRGIIFSALHAFDHALSDFGKAADLDPFNALSYFSRANTRLKLLDLEHSDDPEVISKLNSLSPQMIGGNSYEMAIKDYSEAIALDSAFTYAWYNRATAKMHINDYNGALDDLTRAISYDPDLGEAYYNKGLLLILMRQNETACTCLSKAGELGILEAYPVIKKYCDK